MKESSRLVDMILYGRSFNRIVHTWLNTFVLRNIVLKTRSSVKTMDLEWVSSLVCRFIPLQTPSPSPACDYGAAQGLQPPWRRQDMHLPNFLRVEEMCGLFDGHLFHIRTLVISALIIN